MNCPTAYRQLVRLSAGYDLAATAAFATPWTFALTHQLLGQLAPLPAFEPMHLLFVNLMGSLVVVWSVLRLLRPLPEMGLADAVARGLFFTWQLHYLLVQDGAPIVWLFAVPELAFGIAQGWGWWQLRQAAAGRPLRCPLARRLAATG